MNRIILICVLILLFTAPVFAQVDTAWVRTYPTQYAYAIAVDGEGNVYVTGGYYDYVTIKYTPDGDTAWVRTYNGSGNGNDIASDIAVDASGNVYVTGLSRGSIGGPNYVTIRYNPNGDKAWESTYNGGAYDSATALVIDDNYVYVTGKSYNAQTGFDYATVKSNKNNGSEEWVSRYDLNSLEDVAYAIAVDGSGNSYVTGKGSDSDTSSDMVTIKYNPYGTQLWTKEYSPSYEATPEEGRAIAVDNAGDNVYVTGSNTYDSMGYERHMYITIRYPAAGTGWVKTYETSLSTSYDRPNDLVIDGSGYVWVTGTLGGNYETIKYSPLGEMVWQKKYEGTGFMGSEGHAITLDNFGNVYVTGKSSNSDEYDYATIKYGPTGGEAWIRRHNGSSFLDEARDIAVDSNQNVYVTGTSFGVGYTTIKYVFSSIQCGDANGDGNVTISDVVYLVAYLFKGGPPPNPMWKADVNCSFTIDVSDIIYLQNYLFKGGHSPACCG